MWAALRYRKGQAIALALLSALVTACAVFAPLYDRTMLQSLVDVRLAHTTPLLSGVQLEAAPREMSQYRYDPTPPAPPPTPEKLLDRIPRSAQASYQPPIFGWSDNHVQVQAPLPQSYAGRLMWRTSFCDHVKVTAGRCPSAAGEILVSDGDVDRLGLRVGERLTVADRQPQGLPVGTTRRLTIVGSYDEVPGDPWFVVRLTGSSGTLNDDTPPHKLHDAWLTVPETFTTGPRLEQTESYVGLILRPDKVGVDQMLELGAAFDGLRRSLATRSAESGPRITMTTGLTAIADDVRAQKHDSRVIVPLLMAQLALLCLVVLWLALLAVTDLRRPEVAVARLRGQGVRGSRRLLLGELLPAVGLGIVPGVALAWVGDLVAARILPGEAGVEARLPFWIALAAVAVVLALTALLAASRVARTPVDALLRRSSTVRRGWRVGVVDAVLVTGCAVVVAAFLSGSLDGPVALVAPAIVAMLVGLVLAHLLTPLAAAIGRLQLRRGAARSAVGLLEAARSPALRSTVTVVTIAAALAVFSIDSLVVADRNRAAAAEQQAGAPAVATVASRDLDTVQKAAAQEPGVTPVVRLKAPAADAVMTLAVRTGEFPRIALLPGVDSDAAWTALSDARVQPVRLTGTDLSLRVTNSGLASTATDRSDAGVTLGVDFADAHHVFHHELGTVPRSGSATLRTDLPCAEGCSLTAVTLSTVVGSTMSGKLAVAELAVDDRPVSLGDAWLPFRDPNGGQVAVQASSGGLTLAAHTNGQQRASVSQAWVPEKIPAVVTRAADDRTLNLTGLDGRTRDSKVVGTIARVPGAPARTALVDLDVLQRGAGVSSDARIELWAVDRAALDRVTKALARDGIGLTDTTSLADVRRGLDESTAAWSVQLGMLVGLAAIAVAVLLLGVLAVSGWRQRARDLAALWLSGVPRSAVRRLGWTAQLPAVVLGGVAGAVAGLVGAGVSMPIVPLFAQAPGVDTLDLSTPWAPVLVVSAVALGALVAGSVLLGSSVLRRVALARLRETA